MSDPNQKLPAQNPSTPASMSIQELYAVFQQLHQENLDMRNNMDLLQQQSNNLIAHATVPKTIEPKIAFPEKFDGTRSKFRGFLNQIRLIIQMNPRRYPDDATQVGLLGSLLSGPALSWLAPYIEANSLLLKDFKSFVAELEATFGETDKTFAAANKIRALRQGSRPASTYAAEFRQISCDLAWNDEALIAQFRAGLRDDVKDLMLTQDDVQTVNGIIAQAVRCDNRLFERRQEKRSLISTIPTKRPENPTDGSRSSVQAESGPVPMQLDSARTKGPLTEAEKQRRRANNLCLYCGGPGHLARVCPVKQKTQFGQIMETSENELARGQ